MRGRVAAAIATEMSLFVLAAGLKKTGWVAGLRLVSHESFGLSYARTLAEWRRRFHTGWREIASLQFDDRFRRLWDYYLCYCVAGFL